jgi:hypothetical protein
MTDSIQKKANALIRKAETRDPFAIAKELGILDV